jgi:ABC-2 type transport system permease protein
VAPSGWAAPAWWVVFNRELIWQWIGGRALHLILAYTVLLGLVAFGLAKVSEADLIPPKEMVFFTLQLALGVGCFMGLVLGADSVSGERERATLEALLLTPAGRRQIVLGKLLAGVSPWPVGLAITVPCLVALAQGDEILGPAVLWAVLVGSLLALGLTALGMLVSCFSNSNRTSLFVSLTLYVVLVLPTQWPGPVQKGLVGKFVQRVDPLEAANEFLEKVLVNNRTLQEFSNWLTGPIVFAALTLGLLFLYAGPRLSLWARHR